MYELTPKQAQKIVNKMMKDIPYNINIMDKTGIIIGSGNKKRIGTLHHGAVAAIKQKKIVPIEQDEEFVKKGINLPIEWNDDILGVVGISGEIKETSPFGKLVKSTVLLLIEQSIASEKENRRKNVKHDFFNLLIDPTTIYTKDITDQALFYDVHLNKPSQLVYIEFPKNVNESIVNNYPFFQPYQNTLCVVVQEPNNIKELQEQLAKYQDVFISISKINDKIADGFLQTKLALKVLKGLFFHQKVIFYADCEFIADLSYSLRKIKKTAPQSDLLETNDELIKTLQAYLNCNMNMNETASQLIVHRNTLNYRLNRIHKITGKDPKNILDLLELIFMLINRIK